MSCAHHTAPRSAPGRLREDGAAAEEEERTDDGESADCEVVCVGPAVAVKPHAVTRCRPTAKPKEKQLFKERVIIPDEKKKDKEEDEKEKLRKDLTESYEKRAQEAEKICAKEKMKKTKVMKKPKAMRKIN